MQEIITEKQIKEIGQEQKRVIYVLKNGEFDAYIFVGRLGSNMYFANRENRRDCICLVEYEILKDIEKGEVSIFSDIQAREINEIKPLLLKQEEKRHLHRIERIDKFCLL